MGNFYGRAFLAKIKTTSAYSSLAGLKLSKMEADDQPIENLPPSRWRAMFSGNDRKIMRIGGIGILLGSKAVAQIHDLKLREVFEDWEFQFETDCKIRGLFCVDSISFIEDGATNHNYEIIFKSFGEIQFV